MPPRVIAAGRAVTLWEWIETVPADDADPAEAAVALRRCHDALERAGGAAGPAWARLQEGHGFARMALEGHAGRLIAIGEALDARVRALDPPVRPVHGDSHAGNLAWTAHGPLWIDWEDAHRAPLEWDLACLVATARVVGGDFGAGEELLERYDRAYDDEVLDLCVAVRTYEVAAVGAALLDTPLRDEIQPRLGERLDWLDRRRG